MTNHEVVTAFLSAYQRHDHAAMHDYLDPQVEFSDLAFEKITGPLVRAMWHWFCVPTASRKDPIRVVAFDVGKAEGDSVEARYEVDYVLEGDKQVNYAINAAFTLRHGKIFRQHDTPAISNFRFASMALGFPKCLLALTPFFKPLIRSDMGKKLAAFRAANPPRVAAATNSN